MAFESVDAGHVLGGLEGGMRVPGLDGAVVAAAKQ